MNANELADGIESCTTDPLHKQAATMLRQQQKQLELHKNAHHEAIEICRQQQAEIEALKDELRLIDELVRGKK